MSMSSKRFCARRSLFMASLTVLVGASLAVPMTSAWAGGGCSKGGGCVSDGKKSGYKWGKKKGKHGSKSQQAQNGDGANDGMIEVSDAEGVAIEQAAFSPDLVTDKKDKKVALEKVAAFLESPDSDKATTVLIDAVSTDFVHPQSQESQAPHAFKDGGLLAALGEEFQRCGVSFKGSHCLDKKFTSASGAYENPMLLKSDSVLVFKLLGVEGKALGLVLLTEIAVGHPHTVRSVQVAAYDPKIQQPDHVKAAYLKGKVTPVLSLSIAPAQVEYALNTLKATSDPKLIYHLSDYLLRNTSTCVEVLEKLFSDSRRITQSDLTAYQIALLNLLTEYSLDRSLIDGIANDLLSSQTPEVAHLAAMVLAEGGNKTEIVKQQVRLAMNDKNWQTRKRAVQAFSHIRENAKDDGAFLDAMKDSDSDVKEAARVVVSQMTFTNDHLGDLERHLASTDWSTRRHMIQLLGKIQTPEATRIIFRGLVDSDSDVRKAADDLLGTRQFQNIDAIALRGLAQVKQSDGKVLVTKYLGKIGTKKARTALIELSSDSSWLVRQEALRGLREFPQGSVTAAFFDRVEDKDTDVQKLALSVLETRPLLPSDLGGIEGLMKSNNWSVRQRALGYLARIATSEATGGILGRLCDSDQDVRASAVQYAKERKIGSSEVQVLSTLVAQRACQGKALLPQFLARGYAESPQKAEGGEQIQQAEVALAALSRLAKDSDWSVRMAVVTSLESQRTPEVSDLFLSMLGDKDADISKKLSGILASRKFTARK